jgi:hypothetical protein
MNDVQVMVEHKDYLPRPDIKGFTVAPGTDTRIMVSMRRYARTSWPFDSTNCGNDEDAQYLYSAIEFVCIPSFLLSQLVVQSNVQMGENHELVHTEILLANVHV